jgi:hypothetical protein
MMPGNPDALAQQFRGEEKRAEQVMETFKQKCIDIGVCIMVLLLQLIHSTSYIYIYIGLYIGIGDEIIESIRETMVTAYSKKNMGLFFIHVYRMKTNRSIKTTRGQITCYCPHKMLLPRRQITPQIMLLLHMQIRRYFSKICDKMQ